MDFLSYRTLIPHLLIKKERREGHSLSVSLAGGGGCRAPRLTEGAQTPPALVSLHHDLRNAFRDLL